jgi:hypothetical protein
VKPLDELLGEDVDLVCYSIPPGRKVDLALEDLGLEDYKQ